MSRTVHILIFLGLFTTVLAATHYYIFSRLSFYFNLTESHRRLVAIIFFFLILLVVATLPLSRLLPREVATSLGWAAYSWLGVALIMTIVMLGTDIFWMLFKSFSTSAPQDPSRRLLLRQAFGIAALSSTGLLSGMSFVHALQPVTVKPLSISIKKLPSSLDGLRIAQITDLHIGPMIDGAWLRQVVDKVNALHPHLIAITGDLVDGSVEQLSAFVAPLADLKAPLGVFFVTGNHEYYSGVDAWCAHLASLDINVLRNERVELKAGPQGTCFDIAGVEDWGSDQHDLPKALANRDTNKFLLLLAHQPAQIFQATELHVDLQLSGHTHGGQIWPFTYLVFLQQPYVEGLHRHRNSDTQIYVSPGTGYWGPPMRLGTTAEITHITLRAIAS